MRGSKSLGKRRKAAPQEAKVRPPSSELAAPSMAYLVKEIQERPLMKPILRSEMRM